MFDIGPDTDDTVTVRATEPILSQPDPKPLARRKTGIGRYVGPAISLAVLVAVVAELRHLDIRYIWSIIPVSIGFWLTFVAYYAHGPLTDWIIFRRLWNIPLSGLVALVRKQIGNALLLGYIGEVYFYDWARKRGDISASPFGAVKDVAILSALAGNLVTLVMVAAAWPFVGQLRLGVESKLLVLSVAFVLASSLILMAFRKRLFSLPRNDLWFITAVHVCRVFVGTALSALCWHLALPGVALSWWLLLSAALLLISRLPFITNKDFVFAGLAVFLIGRDVEIPALMTMMASLILATHLGLGGILMVSDLVRAGGE
jgi:hypothetical protein